MKSYTPPAGSLNLRRRGISWSRGRSPPRSPTPVRCAGLRGGRKLPRSPRSLSRPYCAVHSIHNWWEGVDSHHRRQAFQTCALLLSYRPTKPLRLAATSRHCADSNRLNVAFALANPENPASPDTRNALTPCLPVRLARHLRFPDDGDSIPGRVARPLHTSSADFSAEWNTRRPRRANALPARHSDRRKDVCTTYTPREALL